MKSFDLQATIEGLHRGDRRTMAKAITLVESTHPRDRALSQELLMGLSASAGHEVNSFRVGISGPPGAGKSTFIEALSLHLLKLNKRVAVLAVDPSSKRSGGSILGDKTRMGRLVGNARVFIRPSPTGETLGGVTRKTRETIQIVEAAGFDVILIETVGVGQSETTVAGMVDFFALLHLPNAGDDLQGIKRGIMEVANTVIINKADGSFLEPAKQASRGIRTALSLLGSADSGWETDVHLVSALEEKGIEECWQGIWKFYEKMTNNGYIPQKRRSQNIHWMWELIMDGLQDRFTEHPAIRNLLKEQREAVGHGRQTPVNAAALLLDTFKNKG